MVVTRRGDVVYVNDGYSDRSFDVEIASDIYNPERYRVKAASELEALEMVLDYRLSKGLYHPFATEDEFNDIFGDDSWEEQCTYVDQGYWISNVAFVIRQVDTGKGAGKSRAGAQNKASPKSSKPKVLSASKKKARARMPGTWRR